MTKKTRTTAPAKAVTPKILNILNQVPPELLTPALTSLVLKIYFGRANYTDPVVLRSWIDEFIGVWQGYDDEKKIALLTFALRAYEAYRGK